MVWDYYAFRSSDRQLSILKGYYPEVQCDDARFEPLQIEDALGDWYYEFRIDGSAQCLKSIRQAIFRRGYKPHDPNSAFTGLQLPYDPVRENVAFEFSDDGKSVIWKRSKT